jgi:hypothetical protein
VGTIVKLTRPLAYLVTPYFVVYVW